MTLSRGRRRKIKCKQHRSLEMVHLTRQQSPVLNSIDSYMIHEYTPNLVAPAESECNLIQRQHPHTLNRFYPFRNFCLSLSLSDFQPLFCFGHDHTTLKYTLHTHMIHEARWLEITADKWNTEASGNNYKSVCVCGREKEREREREGEREIEMERVRSKYNEGKWAVREYLHTLHSSHSKFPFIYQWQIIVKVGSKKI